MDLAKLEEIETNYAEKQSKTQPEEDMRLLIVLTCEQLRATFTLIGQMGALIDKIGASPQSKLLI